jgi:catechol 2,3-dioxygenase-like lactoylglutathione lyase family enzyme
VFDHVTIRVTDRAASELFYDTVLAVLGVDESYRNASLSEWNDFSLAAANGEHAVTRRLHVAFASPSIEKVHEFWSVGTEAGYADDGPPGPRPEYRDDYYGAFLLDPDGNSVEAVLHGAVRRDGLIDHLWIRVADVAAAKRFYEIVAPHAGLTLWRDLPERAQFSRMGGGSFSLVPGDPTENLHMAFGCGDDGRVRNFYAALVAAGYESIGEPGERPFYHRGYYAAYVRDPDGNNIELVNHNR